MPKIQGHAKNIPEAEERPRTSILDTAQDHRNIFSWLMFVSATMHVHAFILFILYLLLYLFIMPARVPANSIKCICASGWFVRTENNNCTASTNDYYVKEYSEHI